MLAALLDFFARRFDPEKLVDEITSGDVLTAPTPIWTTKSETASRVRQHVETVLDWAIDLTASGAERGEIPDIRTLGKLCRWLGVGPSRQQRVTLPQLRALDPGLRQLRPPAVHTLSLNPVAIPRNSYHRLVKHYQG